jgi:hypothetical protein
MKEVENNTTKSYDEKIHLFDITQQKINDDYKAGFLTDNQRIMASKNLNEMKEVIVKERNLVIKNLHEDDVRRKYKNGIINFESEYENIKRLYKEGKITKEQRIDDYLLLVKIRDDIKKNV